MAEREEIEINLKTTADLTGANQVRQALQQAQQGQGGGQQGGIPYYENARMAAQRQVAVQQQTEQVARLQRAQPVSAAFAALQNARNAPNLQQTEAPIGEGDESRLYQIRVQQSRQFNALQDRRLREQDLLARQEETQRRAQERLTANFTKQTEAQGTTEQLAPEEDPQVQARLYTSRARQQNQYQQLFNQARRQGRAPAGGGEGPQGPGGPPIPPNIQDPFAGAGGGGGGGGGGRNIFDLNTTSVIRFSAALAGLGVGLSIYYFAGRLLHDALQGIVDSEKDATQATINLNAAFGQSAQAYTDLGKTISQGGSGGSGFIFKQSDVQNTISGFKSLQDSLHLSGVQIADLTVAATKLAAIHDIPLQDAASALSQALSGSSGAADKLGLSLSDVVVQTQYANGQFAGAFQLLTPMEQAAARLAVAEQQVADQQKNVGDSVDPLAAATRNLGAAWENLNKSLGNPVVQAAATAVGGLASAIKELNSLIQGLNGLPPILIDIGKGLAVIAAFNIAGPVGAMTALAEVLSGSGLSEKAKSIWDAATKSAGEYVDQARKAVGDTGVGQAAGQVAQKAGEAWQTAVKPVNEFKDAVGQAVNGTAQTGPTSQIDQLAKKDKELAAANDQLTNSVQNYAKASAQVWTALAQSAPAIQAQVNAFTGSVTNINTLTESQRAALAIREAELGALKQHQLQVAQTQSAEFGEVDAVKQLVDAYKQLINTQAEVNRLNQESVQLQGQLAQAQLNALALTRGAQDIELRQQRDRLVGTDRLVSAQERAAARRDLRQANIVAPDIQLRAFDASLPGVAIQRQIEVNQLLTRIATATEAQAQQAVDINITVNGAQVSTHG